MDAVKTATREILDQGCEDMRIAVKGLDAATLARTPAPDTSPLATLVRHATSATRYMLNCSATGRGNFKEYRGEIRPAAFAGDTAEADDLIRLVDQLEEDARRLIEEVPMAQLGERVVLEGTDEQGPTRAWALLHALEHFREHVGHAQLTRQVLGAES